MPAFSQVAVDVPPQRAPAMQDRRREEGLTAFLDPLLQLLLHAVLIFRSKGADLSRQVTKATHCCFNLADSFEVRQLVKPFGKVPGQFQMTLNRPGIAVLTHKLKRHPK